ncbi:MAG TPA: YbhB/YbcL family Raf kinase inhibitor-like protein [Acidimicrobiales bacterium]
MPGDAWWPSPTLGSRRRIGARALAAVAAAVLVAGACGADGRALRPPSADQTTTTTAPASAGDDTAVDAGSATAEEAGTSATVVALQLTSDALVDGAEIPLDHTCLGRDVSPPLVWTGTPPETVELALVVRDVDTGGFVHWVVAGLPPDTGGLAEATVPDDAAEAANDFGRTGWAGPCPPSGRHHYELRLYALAEPSGVTEGQPGGEAATLVETTPALASAVLSGWVEAG